MVLPPGLPVERICDLGREKVELLARNDRPEIECTACSKRPAVQPCAGCYGAALCEECAPDRECGEEMLLPVVDSPRAGVCGYTG